MKVISIFLLLFFTPICNYAQTNIVYNSGFELVEGSNGTRVISLDSAKYWQQRNTVDVYLRKVSEKNTYGNFVRIATYLNETMIGSLRRKIVKGEKVILKFDLYSFKRMKYNKNFSVLFCENHCESISNIPVELKKIKKGWQTISIELIVSNTTEKFCFIGSSNSKEDTFFIDNMEILIDGSFYYDSTIGN